MSGAYYSEWDSYKAQWLRNLIKAGHIAPGDVDERGIEDVRPDDVRGYVQCHWFAGIGVWSLALRRAGWEDSRPAWTASCPCQPFSAAGKGIGFADERHLWPSFFHIVGERMPECLIGEQVANSDAEPWIDLVQADLEGMGYTFGAVPFPSASIGAPHIRDRLYWVANASKGERGRRPNNVSLFSNRSAAGRNKITGDAKRNSELGRLAHGASKRQHGRRPSQEGNGRDAARIESERLRDAGWMPDADGNGRVTGSIAAQAAGHGSATGAASSDDRFGSAGPTNGFWRDADWLGCRDGKWRPVMPETFPLAHGAPARVGRLRAYGDAINAEQARIWIETVMECQP